MLLTDVRPKPASACRGTAGQITCSGVSYLEVAARKAQEHRLWSQSCGLKSQLLPLSHATCATYLFLILIFFGNNID